MHHIIEFVILSAFWGMVSAAGWLVYYRVTKRPARQRQRLAGLLALLCVGLLVTLQLDLLLDEQLVVSAAGRDLNETNRLLDRGADVNTVRDNGWGTPLLQAAASGNPEMVRLLIRRGANVNKGERFWVEDGGWDVYQTPLQVAVRRGHPEVAALLRQAGATR